MIICKQEGEPNRNDEFSRDGISALCLDHKERLDKTKSH